MAGTEQWLKNCEGHDLMSKSLREADQWKRY